MLYISFTTLEAILLFRVTPLLFGKVRECRKSETWSKASLDGVEIEHTAPTSVGLAPVESGLATNPPPFSAKTTLWRNTDWTWISE